MYSEKAYYPNGGVAAQFDYLDDGSLTAAYTHYPDGTLESKFVYRRDGSRKNVRIYRLGLPNKLAAKVGFRREGGWRYLRTYRPDGTRETEATYRSDGTLEAEHGYNRDGSRTTSSSISANGMLQAASPHQGAQPAPRGGGIARRTAWIVLALAGLAFGFGYSHWEGRYPAFNGRDLDCADIGHQVRVGTSDPHGLDRDGDGVGCEVERPTWQGLALLGFGVAALGGLGAIKAFNGE